MSHHTSADLFINREMQNDHSGHNRLKVYLYPQTPFLLRAGSNDYIFRLKDELNRDFQVVNGITRLGLLDLLLKFPKCDLIYFNWIEDLADKRFGILQIILLLFILLSCLITGTRVVWFVHNNVSHQRKNWLAKKLIRKIMGVFSDHILSHSSELNLEARRDVRIFDHPVEEVERLEPAAEYEYDLLIWGSVNRYKGIPAFVKFNNENGPLQQYRIMIAGAFNSHELYEDVMSYRQDNITVVNRVHSGNELRTLFQTSRYILFCYQSESVLSSAALCHSLAYGKTVIGPDRGAFRELQRKGLVYTYRSFTELPQLLNEMTRSATFVDARKLGEYAQLTSWEAFGRFLYAELCSPQTEEAVLAAPAEAIG